MVKIFFDHSIFLHQKNGGISKYVCRLHEGFKNSSYGVETKISCPITINDNITEIQSGKKFFIKFEKIPRYCSKLFYLLNNVCNLFFILIYKPDLIHLTYYNYFLTRFTNIPYVLTVHDLIHEKFFKEKNLKRKNLILNASKIICISHTTKDELINYYKIDRKKITVIHHGIKKQKKKNFIRKNIILYVGDRRKYKNFDKLVNAFRSSKFLMKNFNILCFGGGNFNVSENKVFKKFNLEKKILFEKGNEKKIFNYYKNSKILVYTSEKEGFGIPIIEALSVRCPVLVNDIGVFREVLKNPIFFYKKNNSNSLRKKLEKLLTSQSSLKKNSEIGYRRLINFDLKKNIKSHKDFYESFLR